MLITISFESNLQRLKLRECLYWSHKQNSKHSRPQLQLKLRHKDGWKINYKFARDN